MKRSSIFLKAALIVVFALGSGFVTVEKNPVGIGLVVTGPRECAAEVVYNPSKLALNLAQTATEAAKEAIEEANLTSIVSGVTGLYNLLVAQFKKVSDSLDLKLHAKNAALRAGAMMEMAQVQAEIDARTTNVLLQEQLNALSRIVPPKHEYLCKKIAINEAGLTTQGFEKEVSRMAAEAISARYRCPTCDGMGPDYIAREQGRRCSNGYGNPIDGAAAACKGKTASGKSLADADISPIDGGQIYQMPKIVSKAYVDPVTGTSITVSVPDPENEQQQLWVAAWDNIFLLAGSRPSPRHGKGMKTPVGKVERAMFNHCTASQNALVKQCTDLLAYYTRPYCAELSELCKEQQEKCLAATGFLDLAPYQECGKASGSIAAWQGLSPYEEDQIDQSVCKSEQSTMNMLQAGAKHKDLFLETAGLCDLSNQAWKNFIALKHENCRAATQTMQTLRPCWAGIKG